MLRWLQKHVVSAVAAAGAVVFAAPLSVLPSPDFVALEFEESQGTDHELSATLVNVSWRSIEKLRFEGNVSQNARVFLAGGPGQPQKRINSRTSCSFAEPAWNEESKLSLDPSHSRTLTAAPVPPRPLVFRRLLVGGKNFSANLVWLRRSEVVRCVLFLLFVALVLTVVGAELYGWIAPRREFGELRRRARADDPEEEQRFRRVVRIMVRQALSRRQIDVADPRQDTWIAGIVENAVKAAAKARESLERIVDRCCRDAVCARTDAPALEKSP